MFTLGATVPLVYRSAAASATLAIALPDGELVDPAPTVGASVDGEFVVHYEPPRPGRYTVRWADADGGGSQDAFNVRPGAALALASLADTKKHLNMDATVHVDDEELRGHIEAATGVIERHRNEVVAVRTLTAYVRGQQTLPRHPVLRIVSAAAVVDDTAIDVAGWPKPDPETGIFTVPRSVRGAALVTYVAGHEVVPEEWVRAAEIIAAHLWELQRISSIGGTADADDQYLTPSGLGYAIPNRAVQLLGGRPPVFA